LKTEYDHGEQDRTGHNERCVVEQSVSLNAG
jgi:hypothetical protein